MTMKVWDENEDDNLLESMNKALQKKEEIKRKRKSDNDGYGNLKDKEYFDDED
jgi:hypothetical protein